jgi:uncharacterized protein DUF1918
MPKAGDRVVVEGTKVGGARREGTLVGMVGSLVKIRWTDGGETIMAPGAGAIRFLPGTSKSASKPSKPAGAKVSTSKAKTVQKPAVKGAKKKR